MANINDIRERDTLKYLESLGLRSDTPDERERMRGELAKMTVRELRKFARDNHISLGGASSKRGIIAEIIGQHGSQRGRKEIG